MVKDSLIGNVNFVSSSCIEATEACDCDYEVDICTCNLRTWESTMKYLEHPHHSWHDEHWMLGCTILLFSCGPSLEKVRKQIAQGDTKRG